MNRLRGRAGHFNIEIPVESPDLRPGWNRIRIEVDTTTGAAEGLEAAFHWDPEPLPLPWELPDLSSCESVQDIGQVVDGAFDVDRETNAIVSRVPVASDSLLLLGSAHASQEATYEVRFAAVGGPWCFLGLSDFFVGHEAQPGVVGIKPGYSTAGLATVDHRGRSRVWLAWGDGLSSDQRGWVTRTERQVDFGVLANLTYRVRHQSFLTGELTCSRFRIWPTGEPEPGHWLCNANDLHVDRRLPRARRASFGLFQSIGLPTAWSKIRIHPLEIDLEHDILRRRSRTKTAWWKARAAAGHLVRRSLGSMGGLRESRCSAR